MLPNTDDIIRHLKKQLANAAPRSDGVPSAMPVASSSQIGAAEAELGFAIPPLLKRIYREIGNGGCHLGPGFGLLGLPGGYDNDDGWDIIKTTREVSNGLAWWDRIVVVCDWGCCMLSCVDCSDDEFTVYRWDGNAFDDSTDIDEPSDALWTVETDTFDEWLLTPNANANAT
jgi:hypothetical protein